VCGACVNASVVVWCGVLMAVIVMLVLVMAVIVMLVLVIAVMLVLVMLVPLSAPHMPIRVHNLTAHGKNS